MKKLLLLSLVVLGAFSQVSGQWIQCGLSGPRVMAFAKIGSTFFAGTDDQGLFSSTDKGMYWDKLKMPDIGHPVVSSLATSRNWLFAVIQGKIYGSPDKGSSWTALDSSIKDITIKTIVVKDSFLFAGAAEQGIYRSSDMGKTWQEARTGLSNINIECLIRVVGRIYAGTTAGLFRSEDNGYNWQQVGAELSGKDVTSLTGNALALFAGTQGSGVFRSQDNGLTWTLIKPGLPSERIVSLGSNLTFVIAATETDSYLSTNHGVTWQVAVSDTNSKPVNSIYMTDSIIMLGSKGEVRVGYPDVVSWRTSVIGYPFRWATSILDTKNGSLFVGTNSVGIMKSTDDGKNWYPVNSGIRTDTILCLAQIGDALFAGTDGQGVVRSLDEGNHWTLVNKGITNHYAQALFAAESTLFVSIDSIGIYRSTDKGENWQLLDSVFHKKMVTGFASVGKYIFASTFMDGIYRSSDNGDTWRLVIPANEAEVVLAIGTHGSVVFGGQYEKGIVRSTNNGETWTRLTGTGGNSFSFGSYADKVFYGSSQGVFQSRDNGDNWTYLGLDNGNIVGFVVKGAYLFAASFGKGIWKRDLSTLSANENGDEEKNPRVLLCYPNPATNSLTIDRTTLQFPENAPVHYTLSTLIGGKVMKFDSSEQKFSVQLGGIASGVYCLTAESGGNRAAVMVSLVK